MKHITDINRNRNIKILSQAKELNNFLQSEGINPIFIKGVSNLIINLYDDIAERMIGDIDFILPKEDYKKAVVILKEFGYSELVKEDYHYPTFRHYPRMIKPDNIASIEVHKEFTIEKFANEFNYSSVKNNIKVINNFYVLNNIQKLNLSIISHHINDYGFYCHTIDLRRAYDVLLLSKIVNAKNSIINSKKLKHPFNCFLASAYLVFNKVESLKYNKTKGVATYIISFEKQFSYDANQIEKKHKRIKNYFFIKSRIRDIYKNFHSIKFWILVLRKVIDIEWYKQKLKQFGIK